MSMPGISRLMKYMVRKFIKPKFFVPVLILIFSLLSIYPDIYKLKNTPAGTQYSFYHNSISDYPYYISFIRQGTYGRMNTIDQFTAEPQSPGHLHIFYLWLGKTGSFLSLTPVMIYFFSRIMLGVVFATVGYLFIAYFLKSINARILAFFFFLTSASFPKISIGNEALQISQYLSWWTEMDPVRRFAFIPHFLMGHIGLTGIILLLLIFIRKKNPLHLLGAVFLGLVTGFAHPPSLGMVYYIFGCYLLLHLIPLILRKKYSHIPELMQNALFFLVFVLLTIPSLIIVVRETQTIFPWTLMKNQESLFYYIPLGEYILSLGPVFILGIAGLIISRKTQMILLIWVIFDILMIPFSQKISLLHLPTFANIRFLSMALYLPLSVGAGSLIPVLKRKTAPVFTYGLLAACAILTFSVYPHSIKSYVSDMAGFTYNLYPPQALVAAYQYLDGQPDREKVIYSRRVDSLLLPLYARNQLYYSQAVYTLNHDLKMKEADKFYSGSLKECEVYEFLKNRNISYLLISSADDRDKFGKFIFLKKIFEKQENGDLAEIYQFLRQDGKFPCNK